MPEGKLYEKIEELQRLSRELISLENEGIDLSNSRRKDLQLYQEALLSARDIYSSWPSSKQAKAERTIMLQLGPKGYHEEIEGIKSGESQKKEQSGQSLKQAAYALQIIANENDDKHDGSPYYNIVIGSTLVLPMPEYKYTKIGPSLTLYKDQRGVSFDADLNALSIYTKENTLDIKSMFNDLVGKKIIFMPIKELWEKSKFQKIFRNGMGQLPLTFEAQLFDEKSKVVAEIFDPLRIDDVSHLMKFFETYVLPGKTVVSSVNNELNNLDSKVSYM